MVTVPNSFFLPFLYYLRELFEIKKATNKDKDNKQQHRLLLSSQKYHHHHH